MMLLRVLKMFKRWAQLLKPLNLEPIGISWLVERLWFLGDWDRLNQLVLGDQLSRQRFLGASLSSWETESRKCEIETPHRRVRVEALCVFSWSRHESWCLRYLALFLWGPLTINDQLLSKLKFADASGKYFRKMVSTCTRPSIQVKGAQSCQPPIFSPDICAKSESNPKCLR